MNLTSGLVVYFCLWWVVLYAVLPWGVRVSDAPEKGHAASAPMNPRLGLKMVITTLVAGVFWVIAYFVMERLGDL